MKPLVYLIVAVSLVGCDKSRLFEVPDVGPPEDSTGPAWIELFQAKANVYCGGHASVLKDTIVFTAAGSMQGRIVCK